MHLRPAHAAIPTLTAALLLVSTAPKPATLLSTQSGTAITQPGTPHVLLVMEENKGYAATLGSCSADPYLCSLAAQNASLTGWTGVGHPSLPNYLAATLGSTQGCSNDTCFGPYNGTSLGGQLTSAGVPWTAYMESMPSACYAGPWAPSGTSGGAALYGEKHDPFVTVNDVLNNGCSQHVLPYPGAGGLASALGGSTPPAFVWITPNQQNDMHSGTVQAGDAWLKSNIAPVLASPWFTNSNATVIVTMDEGSSSNVGGGGPVPLVVVSSAASGKGNLATSGNHYGTLRSIEEAYRLPLLGAAAVAGNGDLSALFGHSNSTPSPTPTATSSPTPTSSPTATPTSTPSPTQSPAPSPTPTGSGVACRNDPVHDTAALSAAIGAAATGGSVNIAAGTCALNAHLPLHNPITINGAGPQATFLVQQSSANIFQITAPYVTVENVNLDTATFNPGPGAVKFPKPAVLFSNQSHTTIRNVTAEAGSGFGMRITGPSPCATYQTVGTVVDRLTITNTGTGGFAALDIDCTNGAQLSNLTIHGDYTALYQDENVSLWNENYTPSAKPCQAPWYITGAAANISIDRVQSTGGRGIVKGTTSNIVITNQTASPGCP